MLHGLNENRQSLLQIEHFARRLHSLLTLGVGLSLDTLATAYYKAGELEEAIEIWNEAGATLTSQPFFETAKRRLAPYPDSLNALRQDGKFQDIIRLYEEHLGQSIELSAEQIGAVGAAYLRFEQEKIAGLVDAVNNHEDSLSLLSEVLSHSPDHPAAISTLETATSLLVEEQRWSLLENLVDKAVLPFGPPLRPEHRTLNEYLKAHRSHWLPHLLRTLARSSELAEAGNRVTGDLFKLLKGRLMDPQYLSATSELTMLETGAIIERFGRDRDALSFYERAEGHDKLDKSTRREATLRWIAVKERLAEKDQSEGRTRNADRAISEAINRRSVVNASNTKIPKFPKLDSEARKEVEVVLAPAPTPVPVLDEPVPEVEEAPQATLEPVETVWEKEVVPIVSESAATLPLIVEVAGVRIRTLPEKKRLIIEEVNSGDRLRLGRDEEIETNFDTVSLSDTCVEVPSLKIRLEFDEPGFVMIHWFASQVGMRFPC